MVVDRNAEAPRAPRHRRADPAHADNAEPLAVNPVAQQRRRRPAEPAAGAHQALALDEPARDREDERHGHVGRVARQHARRVGDHDAPLMRGREVDMVHARAEARQQLEAGAGGFQALRVDAVGHGRHQHVRPAHGVEQFGAVPLPVAVVQLGAEQLHHPRLHRVRELARDDDERFGPGGHGPGAYGPVAQDGKAPKAPRPAMRETGTLPSMPKRSSKPRERSPPRGRLRRPRSGRSLFRSGAEITVPDFRSVRLSKAFGGGEEHLGPGGRGMDPKELEIRVLHELTAAATHRFLRCSEASGLDTDPDSCCEASLLTRSPPRILVPSRFLLVDAEFSCQSPNHMRVTSTDSSGVHRTGDR